MMLATLRNVIPTFLKQRAICFPCRFLSSSSNDTYEISVSGPYKLFKLSEGPSEKSEFTKSQAMRYIYDMMMIRRIESTANTMYKEKLIRGFLHLCNGQEAIYVGTHDKMDPLDAVITAYRCHGFAYMLGVSAEHILAELAGAAVGCSRGKGGSMHIYNVDKRFYGGNGIVGAQVPVGTGIAFTYKFKNVPAVSFSFYGDGAANQGQVFEAFNFAKLHMLPSIYVCENNGYGMGTSAQRSSANVDYYTRGDYIPGIWVDAMDVLAVRESVAFARRWCLAGNGPLILEMATYRYMGHSMSDPGLSYRTRQEIEKFRRERDPINTFRDRLIAAGVADKSEFDALEQDVKMKVSEAEVFARKAAKPDIKELSTDVYIQKTHNLEVISPDPRLSISMSL